ncbi:17544_t:CDS:2, partial [Racocetra persica]
SIIVNKSNLCMKDQLPQPFAEKIIDTSNLATHLIYTMNDLESASDASRKRVGVIWLDKPKKICFLVFPNSQRTCITLKISPRPKEKFIVILKTIRGDEPFSIQSCYRPLPSPTVKDEIAYPIKMVVCANKYNELPEMCKIRPYVGIYGNEKIIEVQEMVAAVKALGGIQDKEFENNMSYVLIHVDKINQINYIPRLVELKRTKCKFLQFGWDSMSPDSKLKEIFPQGGIVTVTPKVLYYREVNYLDRIWAIKNLQKIANNAIWSIHIHPNMVKCLESIANQERCKRAVESSIHLKSLYNLGRFDYFDDNEILESEKNISAHSLYNAMLRLHKIYAGYFRHFVIVQDESEIDEPNIQIPGVERMTFSEFRSIFGSQ